MVELIFWHEFNITPCWLVETSLERLELLICTIFRAENVSILPVYNLLFKYLEWVQSAVLFYLQCMMGEFLQLPFHLMSYFRCKESPKSEAYIPCRLALLRIQLMEFWEKYKLAVKMSSALATVVFGMVTSTAVYNHLRGRVANTDTV
jgi:hypothetical protein